MADAEPPPEPAAMILEYRGKDPLLPFGVAATAWMIIVFGAVALLIGVTGCVAIVVDPPWHMPPGEIAEGLAVTGGSLVMGTGLILCGHHLRRAKRWAAILGVVLLTAIILALVAGLIAIAIDWSYHPAYRHWFEVYVARGVVALGFLFIMTWLLWSLIGFLRRHRP